MFAAATPDTSAQRHARTRAAPMNRRGRLWCRTFMLKLQVSEDDKRYVPVPGMLKVTTFPPIRINS